MSVPSVTIPALELKHSIKRHCDYHGLLRGLASKLQDEVPDILNLRLDPESTLLACNIIENVIPKGNPFGLDKLQLVCDVLDALFTFVEFEKEQIKVQVNFLHNNAKIKKLKLRTQAFRAIKEVLVRKFL